MKMDPVAVVLLYLLVPLWLLVGVGDWFCHKKSRIESTSGLKESVIHLLMFGQGALALLAGLFLEVNSGVLILLFTLLFVHECTAFWDLDYAYPLRKIVPMEQHMHSFLEVLPFMALASITTLHWGQFMAVFGMHEASDYSVHMKGHALPKAYVVAVLVAAVGVDSLLYVEEFLRCWRRRRVPRAPAA
jgi:hypothetical protein